PSRCTDRIMPPGRAAASTTSVETFAFCSAYAVARPDIPAPTTRAWTCVDIKFAPRQYGGQPLRPNSRGLYSSLSHECSASLPHSPQGLKPLSFRDFSARLKPCPPGNDQSDGFLLRVEPFSLGGRGFSPGV